MSDQQPAGNQRTLDDLQDMQVRAYVRSEAEVAARAIADNGIHVARVVGISAFGDVQIDRFTDDVTGEWFTPLNRCRPQIGDGVAYTYVDGVPFVLGPIMGEGNSFLLARYQDPFIQADLDIETVDSEYHHSRYVPMLYVDQPGDFIRTAVGFYRDPLVHVWDEHWNTAVPTFEDGGDVGSSTSRVGSSSAPTAIHLTTAATTGNVRYTRLSPNSWLNPMDDFDILMRTAANSSSNNECSMGLLGDPTSPPGSTGVFLRAANATGMVLTAVIRIDNVEIATHAFTTVLDDYQTMRIFSRHFPEASDTAQRRITFQVLAGVKLSETQSVDKDYNLTNDAGEWNVKEEWSYDLTWSGLVLSRYLHVGAAIQTLSNTAKILRVDYIKGWSRMESQRQLSLAK